MGINKDTSILIVVSEAFKFMQEAGVEASITSRAQAFSAYRLLGVLHEMATRTLRSLIDIRHPHKTVLATT